MSAPRFVEGDGGGHGYVEAACPGLDGDGDEGITAGAGAGLQSAAFGAEQERQRATDARAPQGAGNRDRGIGVEAEAQEVRFAQAGQGVGEAANPDDRNGFKGTGRRLGQGAGFPRSVAGGQDQERRPEGRGRAQHRTDVLGVRDPVETDCHRAGPGGPAQALEIGRGERIDRGRDPLVGSSGAGELVDVAAGGTLRNPWRPAPPQQPGERIRKAGPGFAGDEHPVHRPGGILQGSLYRVAAVQPERGRFGSRGPSPGPARAAPGGAGRAAGQAALNRTPSSCSRARLTAEPHA